jgi:hypothetical protein
MVKGKTTLQSLAIGTYVTQIGGTPSGGGKKYGRLYLLLKKDFFCVWHSMEKFLPRFN